MNRPQQIPPDNEPQASESSGQSFLQTAARAARRHISDARERKANELNEAMLAAKRLEFQEMLAHANGINRQALEIIQTANEIPTKSAYHPFGATMTAPDGSKSLQQVKLFSFGEDSQDAPGNFATPLVQDNAAIILHLDSLDWSHNGFRSPLKNAAMTVETPFTEDSSGNRTYGATESHIVLNNQPYDPDTMQFDEHDTFTGKLQVSINSEGHMSIDRSSTSTSGMVKLKESDIPFDLAGILDKIHSATVSTVLAYREIADQLD